MTEFLWSILEINALIALLFGVFKLVQRRLSFTEQRFALLGVPLLAVGAVLFKQLPASGSWSYRLPVVQLDTVGVGRGSAFQPVNAGLFSAENMYWAGVAALFFFALYRLSRIVRFFLLAERRHENGYSVTELPGHDSFSFFRFIQLRQGLEPADRALVFEHEQLHARKLHSLDLLYIEAVHCFGWFNPVLPFLKKELLHIHEFEVDRILYNRHKAGYMEFLLAYSLGTSSSAYLFTHQFLARLTLIKRIKIMKNNTKKRTALLLALPLVAGALALVSWTSGSREAQTGRTSIRHTQASADKPAEFRGGNEALIAYMMENVRYPEAAQKAGVSGKVIVAFVVTKTGKVTQVAIKKGVSPEIDAEALRVVSAMPDWIPGEKAGKKTDADLYLPIAFDLEKQ